MKDVKLLNPDFTSVDLVVDEAMKLLYRIEKMKDPREKTEDIYSEVVQRFGAWRISLARLIKRECRGGIKARFNFFDKVKLPRLIVRTKAGVKLGLVEDIKKILERASDLIGKLQESETFRSNHPDYFYRYGLEIDLKAAFISFNGLAKKKKKPLPRGGQAFLALELLLKKRGELVTYKELLGVCGIEERTQNPQEKGMDIFKTVSAKFKEVGIGPRKLKHFIETNKGYRLILKESW